MRTGGPPHVDESARRAAGGRGRAWSPTGVRRRDAPRSISMGIVSNSPLFGLGCSCTCCVRAESTREYRVPENGEKLKPRDPSPCGARRPPLAWVPSGRAACSTPPLRCPGLAPAPPTNLSSTAQLCASCAQRASRYALAARSRPAVRLAASPRVPRLRGMGSAPSRRGSASAGRRRFRGALAACT
jgi:hypothetical protein